MLQLTASWVISNHKMNLPAALSIQHTAQQSWISHNDLSGAIKCANKN